jgi:hypothetical protein
MMVGRQRIVNPGSVDDAEMKVTDGENVWRRNHLRMKKSRAQESPA